MSVEFLRHDAVWRRFTAVLTLTRICYFAILQRTWESTPASHFPRNENRASQQKRREGLKCSELNHCQLTSLGNFLTFQSRPNKSISFLVILTFLWITIEIRNTVKKYLLSIIVFLASRHKVHVGHAAYQSMHDDVKNTMTPCTHLSDCHELLTWIFSMTCDEFIHDDDTYLYGNHRVHLIHLHFIHCELDLSDFGKLNVSWMLKQAKIFRTVNICIDWVVTWFKS